MIAIFGIPLGFSSARQDGHRHHWPPWLLPRGSHGLRHLGEEPGAVSTLHGLNSCRAGTSVEWIRWEPWAVAAYAWMFSIDSIDVSMITKWITMMNFGRSWRFLLSKPQKTGKSCRRNGIFTKDNGKEKKKCLYLFKLRRNLWNVWRVLWSWSMVTIVFACICKKWIKYWHLRTHGTVELEQLIALWVTAVVFLFVVGCSEDYENICHVQF